MKVKNIVFSGFAAAILMGTANAATTPFEIASKAYVDAQVRTTSTNVGDITDLQKGEGSNIGSDAANVVDALNDLDDAIDTKQNEADSNVATGTYNHLTAGHGVAGNLVALDTALGTAEGKIDSLEEAVNGDGTNPGLSEIVNGDPDDPTDNGLAGRVQTLEGTVGSGTMTVAGATQADVVAAINALDSKTNGIATQGNLEALQTAVGQKQDKSDSTVASTDVTATNHLTAGAGVAGNLVALGNALGAAEADIDTLQGAVGNSTAGLVKDVDDIKSALNDTTTGLAPRVESLEETVGDGQLTGFGAGVTDLTEAVNDLQANKANAADVYTKTQMDTLLGAKLDKPVPNSCTAQSQHCVLHMDNTGALSWVDITVPYVEETQTEP